MVLGQQITHLGSEIDKVEKELAELNQTNEAFPLCAVSCCTRRGKLYLRLPLWAAVSFIAVMRLLLVLYCGGGDNGKRHILASPTDGPVSPTDAPQPDVVASRSTPVDPERHIDGAVFSYIPKESFTLGSGEDEPAEKMRLTMKTRFLAGPLTQMHFKSCKRKYSMYIIVPVLMRVLAQHPEMNYGMIRLMPNTLLR